MARSGRPTLSSLAQGKSGELKLAADVHPNPGYVRDLAASMTAATLPRLLAGQARNPSKPSALRRRLLQNPLDAQQTHTLVNPLMLLLDMGLSQARKQEYAGLGRTRLEGLTG